MDMFTSYGHINQLISQNKITDFLMILASVSLFNELIVVGSILFWL